MPTLQAAADHAMKLPKSEQDQAHWQFAVAMLIEAAETGGGWIMFARMAMLKALNHGKPERVKEPRRKAVKAYRVIR